MEQEKKVILKVDTGESQKSVKSLKQDISDLKDTILNLEKGTDEYNEAVEQLQTAQRELNEVQALTKRTATALEGSYDSLVHQMGLLKKEWRATNDETRRNELGKQIDEINTQLKELDASTGNFQRNVGDYEGKMLNAFQQLKKDIKEYQAQVMSAEEGTEEWSEAMDKLATAQFQMREMNEKSRYSVADLGEQLSNVTGIASGVVSGFNAVQSVMVLCGNETEEFQKVMVKLQAGMALVQGLQGLEGVADRVSGLTSAIKVATKAMGKGGWIGIIIAAVTAITALTVHLVKKNKALKDGTATMKEYNKVTAKAAGAYADEIVQLKLFQKVATDVTKSEKERKEGAVKLLEILREEINTTNILKAVNGDYAKSVEDVTAKLVEQAKMEAALDMIREKQAEILKEEAELNRRIAEDATFWDKLWAGLANGSMAEYGGVMAEEAAKVSAEDFKELAIGRMQRRLDKMKLEFEQWVDNLTKNFNATQLTGDGGSKTDYAALADAEIAVLERTYERKKAIQLQGIDDENERAKIEYDIETELTGLKLSVLNRYLKTAKDLGDTYKQDVINLSNKITDIETTNIKTVEAERQRLNVESLEDMRRYFTEALNEITNYYDTQDVNIEKEISTDEEKNEKLTENLINRISAEKKHNEEYLEWLLLNEEQNKDEIIAVKQKLYQQGLDLLILNTNREKDIRRKNIESLRKDIVALDADYRKAEMEFATDFIPMLENRNFWGELFDWQKQGKQYEDDVFKDEQEYFDRRVKYLEQIKVKQEALLADAKANKDNNAIIDYSQQVADTEIEIEEAKYLKLRMLRDKDYKDEEDKQKARVALVNATMSATSNILNSIADMYESDTEISEKEAKKIKNLRIAAATVDTIQGAVTAFAAAQSLGVPLGPIVGGINAAAVIAMGMANIAKIKSTQVSTTSSGSNSPAAVTPTVSSYSSELPVNYTRNITSASETDELNKATKVYVLESDISDAMTKVSIRESESSF